jgi:pentose-5-phosphate-3-epimerase/CBS domain-containing protein
VKISASIYSQREKPLAEIVGQLSGHGVDMLHIDCRDTPATFDDIRTIRQLTDTPIDLHIIAAEPQKYFDLIKELHIEYVSLQYEDMGGVIAVPDISGTKFGLAIKSETSLDVLKETKGYSYMMLMCTTPGMSGGTFQKENFSRIIEIRQRYPRLKIQVDGGVNDEVAYILRLLGVDSIVSGSFLLNHYTIGSGMLSFYKKPAGGDFLVKDFMIPTAYLPVLKEQDLSFAKVLQTIEDYKQGFVLVTDENNSLKGLISNADLRRGLLKQMPNIADIDVRQMINRNPVNISGEATLGQMLTKIDALNFIILFLPVVDGTGHLQGAVLLNNLTKG